MKSEGGMFLSFFERYSECCKLRGIQPVSQEAADALGCSKSTISMIARNNTVPKGETVARAAHMLGVSTDYLLEVSDVPIVIACDSTLSQDEIELIMAYRKLNTKGQNAVKATTKGLEKTKEYKADSIEK